MKAALKSPLVIVVAALLIFIGFRLVTQAGQEWPLIQNDGYAVSGGVLILLGGILTGLWLGDDKKRK